MEIDGWLLEYAGHGNEQSELLLPDHPSPQSNVAKHYTDVLIGPDTCGHCTRVCPQLEMRLRSRANWFDLGRLNDAVAPSIRRKSGILTFLAARTEARHSHWRDYERENVRHCLLSDRDEWCARALDSSNVLC